MDYCDFLEQDEMHVKTLIESIISLNKLEHSYGKVIISLNILLHENGTDEVIRCT